jgi:DNA-binding GntR family transcriptional regulator
MRGPFRLVGHMTMRNMLHANRASHAIIEGMKKAPSLTNRVMDHVREAVISGEMPAGSWHSVYQLSEQLGISRSPVRDGLLRLEEAGLVKFSPNKGFCIVETTANDVAEIFGIRLGIEPAAAYRAALHRTDEDLTAIDEAVTQMTDATHRGDVDEFFTADRALHRRIMLAGHATRGADIVDQLRVHTRILGPTTAGTSRSLQDILNEHQPVVDAIRRGSSEVARATMREHITITGHLLLTQAMPETLPDEIEKVWTRLTAGL